jgi:methylenetetrahydrofolate reductase (NADPH)
MNLGQYLDDNIENGAKSEFCIGVAGYPEKHFEAPNFDTDIRYLKEKVDAGADYIVTQMFFDNEKFFAFVDACRKADIKVPIIPGIKPVIKKYQLNSIPRKFYINFPLDFVQEMMKANTPEAIRQVGIEWTIQQCKELIAFGVPCLHFYTMGDTATILEIISNL